MSLENLLSNIKRGVEHLLVPILFGSILSCSSPVYPPEKTPPSHQKTPAPTSAPEVPGNVKPMPYDVGERIIYFDEGQINFSESTAEVNSLSPGDIIVFDKASQIPKGLLAKVQSVSYDGKTIYTTPAAFEEVIKNYSFNIDDYKLQPSQIVSSNLEKGVTREDIGDFTYNFDNVIIFDADGNESTTYDQIILNGKISFDTNFSLNLKIGDSLEELSFGAEFTDSINITASSSDYFSNIDEYKQIAYHEFPDIWFTIPATPIPVVITPAFAFGVGVEGYLPKLSTNLSQNATLNIGASYDGEWHPTKNFQNNFDFDPPHFSGDSDIFAYASGKFFVYLYHSIGGYAEAKAGPKFESWIEGTNNYWELSGQLQGGVGIDIGVFGKSIADFNKNLIDYSKVLASGSVQIPEKTLVIQPGPEGKDMFITTSFWSSGDKYSSHDETYLDVENFGYSAWKSDSLIQFPLSSIPYNANLVSAKLQLYGQGAFIEETADIKVYEITSPWTESEWGPTTSNQSPSYGDFITSSTVTDEKKWHEWDITSLVRGWISGDPNYGLVLKTNVMRPNEEDGFKSSDYSVSSERPKLIIKYIE